MMSWFESHVGVSSVYEIHDMRLTHVSLCEEQILMGLSLIFTYNFCSKLLSVPLIGRLNKLPGTK